MRYPSAAPVEGGLSFERAYGSFIRFEPGRLIDRDGSDELVAPRRP
jgi:hypothetical protein